MTTIRLDGQDPGTYGRQDPGTYGRLDPASYGRQDSQTQMSEPQSYALPLNTTSAINIQLFEQQQQQQQYPYDGGVPISPSASTYVCTHHHCQQDRVPDKYSVIINTDDRPPTTDVYPINVVDFSPPVYSTLPQQHQLTKPQQQQQLPQPQQQLTKPQQQQQQLQQQQLTKPRQLQQEQQQLQQQQQQLTTQQFFPEQQQDEQHSHLPQQPQRHEHRALIHHENLIQTDAGKHVQDTRLNCDNQGLPALSIDTQTDIIGLQQHDGSSMNYDSTMNMIQLGMPHGQRTPLFSVGSEPDSARGSIPDDTASVNSSGSRGTTGSLNDGMTSLNLSNDDVIVTHQEQQDFIYGRVQSLSDSMDSQLSNYGSMASPTSAAPPHKDKKHVKFGNVLPLTWDEDEGSENSLEGSMDAKMMDASAFILDDFTEEETRTVEDAEGLKGTRVAFYRGEVLTAMLKVKVSTEQMGLDLRVLKLLQDILVRCDELGLRMKGSAVRLTPFHLNKMRLSDGRPSKEHAAEVARVLGGDIILCEAVCQKHADRIHIATDIKEPVYEKGPFSVGRLGVLVTLWKKHKYSVAAEFSAPLCDHIHFYRPHLLGNTSETALKRKRKGTDTVRKVFQSRELLSQMFKADPTITVAESARRSFVEILFYALYE